jgi:hypothetical protein
MMILPCDAGRAVLMVSAASPCCCAQAVIAVSLLFPKEHGPDPPVPPDVPRIGATNVLCITASSAEARHSANCSSLKLAPANQSGAFSFCANHGRNFVGRLDEHSRHDPYGCSVGGDCRKRIRSGCCVDRARLVDRSGSRQGLMTPTAGLVTWIGAVRRRNGLSNPAPNAPPRPPIVKLGTPASCGREVPALDARGGVESGHRHG